MPQPRVPRSARTVKKGLYLALNICSQQNFILYLKISKHLQVSRLAV